MLLSKKIAMTVGLALLLDVPAFGSGGSNDCEYVACYSFFMPEIIGRRDAMFFIGQTFYDTSFPPIPSLDDMNIQEWNRYFNSAIPQDYLTVLVYKLPFAEIVDLSASLDGKRISLSPNTAMIGESLKGYWNKNRVRQTLQYLQLAKRVEPIAMANFGRSPWDPGPKPPPTDPDLVQELVNMAERLRRSADNFLSQRYRFQALRLMFYAQQYGEAQQYFERNKASFTEENSTKYRFMDVAAGAYYKQKKFAEANYLYSRVFDKSQPLRWAAYRSFHPMEDADWRGTLALARNNREREVLWHLLGMYADGFAGIEAIYAINPNSDALPLLLVREVNKIERSWTANENREAYYGFNRVVLNSQERRPDRDVVGAQRLEKIKRIADQRNTPKRYLWLLATGHLLALAGDTGASQQYIQEAMKSLPADEDIRAQARMSFLFARVRAINRIEKPSETWLSQELTWLDEYSGGPSRTAVNYRARTLKEWVLNHLRDVYREGSDPVRALLLQDSPEGDDYRSVPRIDAIVAFIREASTPFDQFLVKNYGYSVGDLNELRGLNFLFDGNFGSAVEALRLAGNDTASRALNADPFTIRIRDCHYCDASAPHKSYTKVSFAEGMLDLSRRAQGRGEDAALASFELANGLYNMSFYGNARDVYDTSRLNLSPRWEYAPSVSPAVRTDLAEKYYLQAAALSSDRELKTKATFMAAKAEQTRSNDRTHFRTLQQSYSNTAYYQEIIRECGYFRSFLGL